ncbi:23S rRNA (adenine(1618)-N(6))-methyltransferase RlmF [Flavobacterium alkalisoli]|uniref:Ribosomal RNA large subunit methyltransferase F n=1 Tax=Flavobacterium alkalisoli TaxID=2602769 RepID=A0A5B9FWB0_9FLAO|nr:23S rRNA (adenine(1618)-N(6))-methyltransferase RlmF [Flavobacterium alkalisoli]QEE49012.1 23S rRNA (adenine(1618)-N(6))-methyltransferase RlmF [Flavobacterium alkalisoli]
MSLKKDREEKSQLHSRNKNRGLYDLNALVAAVPQLADFIKPNKFGNDSVDFSNPVAVKLLNKALLNHYYGIQHWDFPDKNLCPPIPGRADYIHYLADLLAESNNGTISLGNKITCLDVGTGASCIYPILGVTEYNWNFIASDIAIASIESAKSITDTNPILKDKIECRLQNNPKNIFTGIIGTQEKIDVTLCNPPFHSSAEEAQKGTQRKVKNLSGKKHKTPELNFAGISNELIYDGGEYRFVATMITESQKMAKNCYWFTTLVSKQSNLKGIYKALDHVGANVVKTIPMGTGNKSTRIVAWTFLNEKEQKEWRESRWRI